MLDALARLTDRLPGTCQVCARWPARPVCSACEQRFVLRQAPHRVASPVSPAAQMEQRACLDGPQNRAVQRCVTAVDYGYPWDALIARFKFQQESGWAHTLAGLMLDAPGALPLLAGADLIAPVPLSAERLGSRGFNQAWALVQALRRQAHARGHPSPAPLAQALVRLRQTTDQHRLSREERLKNLHGAFVAHPEQAARLAGAQVLLVDDVRTTGATLERAAQALLQAGAAGVNALVFARTPPH
jgi:ComF family protein